MRRERACKGCDGSGYVHRPDFFSDMPHTDHAATCWCGATECECCEGTGRVVDHIPAADAVADAETLLRAAWDALKPHAANTLRKARCAGVRLDGFEAARAAFRAVPGLRG